MSRAKRKSSSEPLVEIEIDELAAGGDGVGRLPDGRVVFVPFTAPGDRVAVRIVGARQRYSRASVVRLIEPGADRTDPVCAVYGSCGGCSWQHVRYDAQLDAKVAIVTAALQRIGGLALAEKISITPSPSAYGYRTRSRVLVDRGRAGYRRRRSHALCATDRCPLLVAELDDALGELTRSKPKDGEYELAYGRAPDGAMVARTTPLRAGDRESSSPSAPNLSLPVADDRIGFSPGAFVQSNASLLDALADGVFEAAGSGAVALDLFAGAGFFTLGLARRFERVTAVEANPTASRDLEFNLDAAGLANTRTIASSVEDAIVSKVLETPRPDTIVLDPPRTGLPEDTADYLAGLEPERFVYLSCDPATLARDLSIFDHYGYALRSARAFDLFPQTPHVEVLAVAERTWPREDGTGEG